MRADLPHPRLGLSVSKKVGNAVVAQSLEATDPRGLSAVAGMNCRQESIWSSGRRRERRRAGRDSPSLIALATPRREATSPPGLDADWRPSGVEPPEASRCGSSAKSIRLPCPAVILLVRLYQLTLSPFFGRQCRFQPTCSHYMIGAVEKYGVLRGVPLKGFWRISAAIRSATAAMIRRNRWEAGVLPRRVARQGPRAVPSSASSRRCDQSAHRYTGWIP